MVGGKASKIPGSIRNSVSFLFAKLPAAIFVGAELLRPSRCPRLRPPISLLSPGFSPRFSFSRG